MKVLYNEIDPFAADWLERLVAAGSIPPGIIDRRSICDLSPDDVRSYRQVHFFAGIGVWAYALGQAGWPEDRQCWTGSCPCQPFSGAGRKQGFDDERDLWPVWAELIRACEPTVVFGEQVTGPAGRTWLARVSDDLRDQRFDVGAADLPGAGVGAPHGRPRHFFVGARLGHSTGVHEKRNRTVAVKIEEQEQPHRRAGALGERHSMDSFWADADLAGCRDGWRRPVEPGTRPVAPRTATHMGRMRAYGNAIVAPVAETFIRSFLEAEQDLT